MINTASNTYVVNRGDCPWNVAKHNLKSRNEKVTNKQIIEEMNRLAELNGCNSVEDFAQKYFIGIGKELRLTEKSTKKDTENQGSSADKTNPGKKNTPPNAAEVERINQMNNDTDRIVEYNKTHCQGEHYGIIDKKTCQLKIYDKEGNVIQTFPVGVGKAKGDKLGSGYLSSDPAKHESGRYTTPGECTLDEYKSSSNSNYVSKRDGKHKFMALKGDNMGEDAAQQGIHMIPNNRKERKHALDTKTPDDNRVSYGCVNMKEDDYDEMAKYLGEGDKIYILPEEKGNKLQLEKQTDGSYRFEQQYHKKQKRGTDKDKACKVNYNVRPERDPSKASTSALNLTEIHQLLSGLLSSL